MIAAHGDQVNSFCAHGKLSHEFVASLFTEHEHGRHPPEGFAHKSFSSVWGLRERDQLRRSRARRSKQVRAVEQVQFSKPGLRSQAKHAFRNSQPAAPRAPTATQDACSSES